MQTPETPAPPVLTLQTLGAALLRGPDGRVVQGIGAKAMGLVAILAVQPGNAATRDLLTDLLWGSVAPEQGRGSLRQELRRLKCALGPLFEQAFETPGAQIALRPGAMVSDVGRLEAACAARDTAGLSVLPELWGGAFLAPLSVPETSFQDWVAERNSQLEALAVEGLLRLMLLDEAAGRLERAQSAARALLVIDPLQEDVHAALVRLNVAAGRIPQARRQVEAARKLFLEELGEEPETDLDALIPAAAPRRAPAAPKARPARAAVPPDRPLVAIGPGEAAQGAEPLLSALRAALLDRLGPMTGLRTLDAAAIGASAFDRADWLVHVSAEADPGAAVSLSRGGDAACFAARWRDWPAEAETAPAVGLSAMLAGALAAELIALETAAAPPLAEAAPGWPRLMAARAALLSDDPAAPLAVQEALETELRRSPEDVTTLCLLARAHLAEGLSGFSLSPREALFRGREVARRALERAPADPWALHLHGLGRGLMQDPDGDRRAQLRALEAAPGFAPAIGEVARLLALSGDVAETELWSARALALAPRAAEAAAWRRAPALARFARGDAAGALTALECAAPETTECALLRAASLRQLGREAEAAAALETVAARLDAAPGAVEAFRLAHAFAHSSRTEALLAPLAARSPARNPA